MPTTYSFNPLPVVGSAQVNWGKAGPFQAPNNNLYQVGIIRNGSTVTIAMQSSTDGGITWNTIGSSNPSLTASVSCATIKDTLIYVLLFKTFAGSTLSRVEVFDTAIDDWVTPITGIPATVLNNGGDQWVYLNPQIAVVSASNIYLTYGYTTSSINTPGSIVKYSNYNGTSWGAFTAIPGQGTNSSYAPRSMVVTNGGNVYTFLSGYPYVQAGGSQPNGDGDLAYSVNFGTITNIEAATLPYTWPVPDSYDIAWQEYHAVGYPTYNGTQIAIPYLSGSATSSSTNPPPYNSPAGQVSCAIISTPDATPSVAIEVITTTDTICPNINSREQALSCTWYQNKLNVFGIVATQFTTLGTTTSQESSLANVIYWIRTSPGTWGTSSIAYTGTLTTTVPSGIMPIVYGTSTNLGLMMFGLDITTPFNNNTRQHFWAGSTFTPATLFGSCPTTNTLHIGTAYTSTLTATNGNGTYAFEVLS